MPEDFTVEQLLLDESFINYCLHPDGENTSKWEAAIIDNRVSIDTIHEARALLNVLQPVLGVSEVSEEIKKLRDQINEKELFPLRRKKRSNISIFTIVGVAVLVTVVGLLATNRSGSKAEKVIAKFQTSTGQQKKINLPDGTLVILNSNSSIEYTEGYNMSERKVMLAGNAFFDVAKDAARPFSVVSDEFSTTALGTKFYVRSDSAERYSVSLLEGRVKINSSLRDGSLLLTPGEEANWKPGNTQFIRSGYDTSFLKNWVTGKIKFDKTPFSEAIQVLEQWYGVEIDDNRNLKDEISINGIYENVLLEDILKVICFSLNCKIVYEKNTISIR